MGEIIFVVLLAGGMLIPGIFVGITTKRWQLLGVFGTFFVLFGLWEWHAVANTGFSISQNLWQIGEGSPKTLWSIIGSLAVAWGALMWHFATKMLGKK